MGAAGALGLVSASTRVARANEYYTVAAQIARAEIETLRSTRACLLANRTDSALVSGSAALSQLPSGAGKLTIADSALLGGAKDITVTVEWATIDGSPKSLTLQTLVSPDGPTH